MKHSSTTASAATLTYVFADAAAHRAGFRPDVRFETHSPGSIRELVNAGLGVALVAQSVADAPGPPVGVHQPQPAEAHPSIALIRGGMAAQRGRAPAFRRAEPCGAAVISDLPSPQGDKSKITNSQARLTLRMAALSLDHSTAATAARSSSAWPASAALVRRRSNSRTSCGVCISACSMSRMSLSASSIGNPGV